MSKNKKDKSNQNNTKENDETLQISLIGNSNVGKTCIIQTYYNNQFIKSCLPTIGYDYIYKIIKLSNGKKVKLKIIDTAGQEIYKSLCLNYLRNSKGVILVYSIDDLESFNSIKEFWLSEIYNYIQENTIIYLIGNKSDLIDERVIDIEEGKELADNKNLKFMEVSAKNNYKIKDIFTEIAEDIYQKNFSKRENNNNNNNNNNKNHNNNNSNNNNKNNNDNNNNNNTNNDNNNNNDDNQNNFKENNDDISKAKTFQLNDKKNKFEKKNFFSKHC